MFFSLFNIPRAPNTGTGIQQGDLFYSAGLHRNWLTASQNQVISLFDNR